MRLSVEWLAEYVDLADKTPAEIGELYTLHVAEVDGVHAPAEAWAGIRVAAVTAVRPHPSADRLRLVTVDTGDAPAEVVCGAPNVAEGQRICYAPENTTLPDGLVLKPKKIRGVLSRGMVLSERELGLSEEHEGILVLPEDAPLGVPVADVLPGGAAIDVDNTAITTRPDLWGHYGAARELAAVLERDLAPLELGPPPPEDDAPLAVDVACPDLCPRYLGWVIEGVTVGPSPSWLRQRLEAAGQRPINNVVDLTNFILLESGQPLHAFDRRQIAQERVVVRRAAAGERVTTLDGVERALPEGACVIADPERAVAVAGVMGLANSEVMDDTTAIVLEVANFDPVSVRSTSQALGLRTESAVRFEKGVDVEGVLPAARRFLHLLRTVCPDARPVGGPRDARTDPAPPRVIECDAGWIGRRLGLELPPERVDGILGRLGYGVARADGRIAVTVPTWRRRDTAIPEDLVEDVGRVHGYRHIAPRPLHGRLDPVPAEPARAARRDVRDALSFDAGLTEIYTYPFTTAADCAKSGVPAGELQLANAEQPGLDLLAASHLPRMLQAVAGNLRYRDAFGLYVVAPVFARGADGGLPDEREVVTLAIARAKGAPAVYAAKGAGEAVLARFRTAPRVRQEEGPAWLHPGRAAVWARGKQVIGRFGALHPRVLSAWDIEADVAVAEFELGVLMGARGKPARMAPISRYPTVPYDVAVVVDATTPAAEVEAALAGADKKLVRGVRLFDVYAGRSLPEGKRSLAFAIVFGSHERTLGPDEIDALRAKVGTVVAKRGWTLRV